jgi:hypothetical protein
MNFEVAQRYVMPFGKYKGKSLDDIGSSDEGLRYLDYMRGILDGGPALTMIAKYLDEPVIARELRSIIDDE